MNRSGRLARDEVWQGIVLIEGDVIIPSGKQLKIMPGTIVRFAGKRDWGDTSGFRMDLGNYAHYPRSKIIVEGQLLSNGTPENKIIFTSNAEKPEGGDWFGILFRQNCFSQAKSEISYSIVEYGLKNIVAGYADSKEFCPDNPLLIKNDIIRHANKSIRCQEPNPGGPQLRALGVEIRGWPTMVQGNVIYDNFKGIANDYPSVIKNNIIAFHDQYCFGDAPGTGIRTTGVDSAIWPAGTKLDIENNVFFQKSMGY